MAPQIVSLACGQKVYLADKNTFLHVYDDKDKDINIIKRSAKARSVSVGSYSQCSDRSEQSTATPTNRSDRCQDQLDKDMQSIGSSAESESNGVRSTGQEYILKNTFVEFLSDHDKAIKRSAKARSKSADGGLFTFSDRSAQSTATPTDRSDRSQRNVEFDNDEDKAIERSACANSASVDSHSTCSDRSKQSTATSTNGCLLLVPPQDMGRTVLLKNLDKTIDDQALYDTFISFGEIQSCKVLVASNPGTGESPGNDGFVTYDTEEAAKKTIELVNGMQIGENIVEVEECSHDDMVKMTAQ